MALLTTLEQYRRADLVFSISYDANIKKQRHHTSILENNPKVLKNQSLKCL
jgi:hypothetical protein